MKHLFNYILASFILLSCSSNDDMTEVNQCKMTTYETAQLYFEYMERQNIGMVSSFYFNSNFQGIHLEYDTQNRIKKVTGGPVRIPQGPNLSVWGFDNIEYIIAYSGNSINITSPIESFYGDVNNDYTVNNDIIVNRSIIIPNGLIYEKIDFLYEYEENIVLEYKNGDLFRTFYLENNNLVKVEELVYYNINNPLEESDILYAKHEIIFSEFDDLPNLLQGLFYIDGAFFKAFSKNNYHKVSHDYYLFDQDTQQFIPQSVDMNWRSYNFEVNEDGSSGLFKTDCLEPN